MKNSLFKRAIAVAASAPLALTQCLTVANAASINNADIAAVANETFTADKTVKLNGTDGLIYIEPGKDDNDKDYYITDGKALADIEEFTADEYTITKDSAWNELVYGKLTSEAGKSGSFSVQGILSDAAKKAGNYKDITSRIAKCVGDVKYTIDKNGDITLTCDVTDIVPELTAGSEKTVGKVFDDIEKMYAAYGVKIDKNTAFSDVKIGGTFTAVIKGSSLDDTKVEGTITFKSLDGVEYKGTAVIDYALAQLDKLQSDAKTAISDAINAAAALDEKTEKIAEAEAQVDDSIGYFKKQLNRAKTWPAKAQSKTTELKEYGTFGEALEAAKASRFGKKLEDKLNKDIPASGSEAAKDATANKYFDKAIKLIEDNTAFDVQITSAELGSFADSLTNITAQLLGGTATFSAQFDDAEKDAVAEYLLSEYGLQLTDSYKTIGITADYSAVNNGEASVDVKMQRIVKAVTTVSTTSTSTETTSTETETTSTESETTSTETETTSTETETTSTETETTSTETETTTASTSTDEGTGSSTTTTKVVKLAANYYVTSKTGFYLNIDEEFNKEQLESVYVSYDETEISYGEAIVNGQREIVSQKVLTKGKDVNVTDKGDFGTQTPANVFVKGDYKFSHELALYATEDIVIKDFDGNDVIATASGAALTNADGTTAITIAYVGVKGDGDLNYMAESKDASLVLVWYAKMSTMDDPDERAAEVFSNSDQITEIDENGERVIREEYDKNLDQFAAFLCDVDNENADDNWYALKKVRTIDAKDASFIKVMYSWSSTGENPDRKSWNEVLGNFAKKAKTEA